MPLFVHPTSQPPAMRQRGQLRRMSPDTLELESLGQRVQLALNSADLDSFAALLAIDVHWGPPEGSDADCHSRAEVLEWWSRSRRAGARASVIEVVPGAGALLVGLNVSGTTAAEHQGGETQRWQVLAVESGLIVDICGFDNRNDAALRAGVADR